MKRALVVILAVVSLALLLLAGCGQPAPSAPGSEVVTKAVLPTVAQAVASPTIPPTAASALAAGGEPPKVSYPEKGRAVMIIVPWAAGGSVDTTARLLAAPLEKDLGVPFQIVNKPGATGEVGLTELAKSKPDGYTIGLHSLPVSITVYLDPSRKATYSRKDFELIANQVTDVGAIAVRADSPYKHVKDLVDAARAKPEQIKIASTGPMSIADLTGAQLEKIASVKFAMVNFDSAAPATTAVLGGHVDAFIGTLGSFPSQVRSGELRVLGVMDRQESRFTPGVKTFPAQGYDITFAMARGYAAPAGTPKPIIDILAQAIKRAMDTDELKKRMDEAMLPLDYKDPAQYSAYWDELEAQVKPLMELARKR